MPFSRRAFLGGLFAATATPRLFAKAAADYDPNLTVFLSDIHINGRSEGETYQRDRFAASVAEILRMDPLPKRAVVFGDLAYLWGLKEDYQCSAAYLKQLTDAGIEVTIGMGNHDRRSTFLEVHPQYAQTTKVPGRIVSVVDAGNVDILMLDGLQGTDDRGLRDMGPVPGALDRDQQDWLLAELPKWKKPVFVCSHFPFKELSAGGKPLSVLMENAVPVAGYIHGHDHRWYKTYVRNGYKTGVVKRGLCLPSTGHWGDIGYTLFRTFGDHAVATLRQREFFFPKPEPKQDSSRTLWSFITAENQGLSCTFPLPKI